MNALRTPLTFEQRQGVGVLVWARWAMLVVLTLTLVLPLNSSAFMLGVVASAMAVVGGCNAVLHYRLREDQSLSVAGPLALGGLDAVAITACIAAIDGFDNSAYVLYFPALMSFSAIFPGRISITYSAAIIAGYSFLSVTIYRRFDRTTADDWHDLGLRISTMMVTVVLGYLLVRVERLRRIRAVEAERERQEELFALEERTRDLERSAAVERSRLRREIHDGVSQGLYMVSLGLEDAAIQAGRDGSSDRGEARLRALLQVSKQTLFDARGLLLELNYEASDAQSLVDFIERQLEEFRAVTELSATLAIRGEARLLPAGVVHSVHRVLQEGLANVYRHSGARRVDVLLSFTASCVTLRLADDGRGPGPGLQAHGHGLRSMAERAAACGGSVKIEEAFGGGTSLEFSVPLEVPA